MLAVNKLGRGRFEIVRPSLSILAEPPVALVDAVVAKKRHAPSRASISAVSLLACKAKRSSRATTSVRDLRRWQNDTLRSSRR